MIKFKDWVLDSQEELFFCYWLDALKEAGYINEFSRIEEPILIFDKVSFDFFIKGKPLTKAILRPISYTPDFYISWNEKAEGVFLAIRGHDYELKDFKRCVFYSEDLTSIVDVKGTFRNPKVISATTFPIIQKILAYKGLYIQEVKPFGPKGLFARTFTPTEYHFTPTGRIKKIPWTPLSLNQYVKK